MKRPSFQFYVGDWQSNSNLRRCTFAEKGIWLDVMCLMHDGEEYGVLRWPLKEIAQAVGCKVTDLKALVVKGVLKGAESGDKFEAYIYTPRSGGKDGEPVTLIPTQPGPLWYSSRMVKDDHVSKNRGKGTRFGEDRTYNNDTDESTPTRRVGVRQGDKPSQRVEYGPSTSSSTSSSEGKEPSSDKTPLPPWVPIPEWDSFVEMRKQIPRCPFTNRARTLALNRLDELRKQGHEPINMLNEAVLNSWKTFYPPKQNYGNRNQKPQPSSVEKRTAALYRAGIGHGEGESVEPGASGSEAGFEPERKASPEGRGGATEELVAPSGTAGNHDVPWKSDPALPANEHGGDTVALAV